MVEERGQAYHYGGALRLCSTIVEFVFNSQAVFYSFFTVIQQQLIGVIGSVRCLSPIVPLPS